MIDTVKIFAAKPRIERLSFITTGFVGRFRQFDVNGAFARLKEARGAMKGISTKDWEVNPGEISDDQWEEYWAENEIINEYQAAKYEAIRYNPYDGDSW